MTKKLDLTLKRVAERMADHLLDHADRNGVDLDGITQQNFNSFLDTEFQDGGEARCEHFADLGWDYANQFDEASWDDAQARAISAGLSALIRKLHERDKEDWLREMLYLELQ